MKQRTSLPLDRGGALACRHVVTAVYSLRGEEAAGTAAQGSLGVIQLAVDGLGRIGPTYHTRLTYP